MKTDPSARDLPSKCSLRFHSVLLPDPVHAGVGEPRRRRLLTSKAGARSATTSLSHLNTVFVYTYRLEPELAIRTFVVPEPHPSSVELWRNYHTSLWPGVAEECG